MNDELFAIKGDIIFAPEPGEMEIHCDSFLVCQARKVGGIYHRLPQWFEKIPVLDYSGKIIIPGMTDLHLHASQYGFRGYGMDLELLDWLEIFAFPEETCFESPEYAEKLYGLFVDDLLRTSTTRACIFASIHTNATLRLMEILEEKGLSTFVGKVNMDRNSPSYYSETTQESLSETNRWLDGCENFRLTKPILTPRFTPSVTDSLMESLGKLRAEKGLPVHSHLSENLSEISWVKELCPGVEIYAESYDRFGMLGGEGGCIMAHCVWCDEKEIELLKNGDVFIAHCPTSNTNVIAGIAPAAKYLRGGMKIGLGSDVAGGETLNIFEVMTSAVKASKLRWRHVEQEEKPLSMAEAFYLATKGGGAFFGRVGSFEQGYDFDAVVIDDSCIPGSGRYSPLQRLERFAYLSDGTVEAKFVKGNKVL